MRVFDESGRLIGGTHLRPVAAPTMVFSIVFVLLLSAIQSLAAAPPNLSKPLSVCRTLSADGLFAADSALVVLRRGQTLIALEPGALSELWRTDLGNSAGGAILDGNDLFSLNGTEDGLVSAVAYSRATGLEVWRSGSFSGKRRIIAVGPANLLLSDETGAVYAVDRRSGTAVWTAETGGQLIATFDGGELLAFGQNGTSKVTTDGKVIFQTVFESAGMPTVAARNLDSVFFGYPDGLLAAFETSGRRRWSYRLGGRVSFLLPTVRGIVAGSFDNFLYLFDSATGRQVWKRRVAGRIVERPLIVGESVVVADAGSSSVSVIELKSGRSINQLNVGDDRFVTGPIYLSDDKLIVPVNGGVVVAGTNCK